MNRRKIISFHIVALFFGFQVIAQNATWPSNSVDLDCILRTDSASYRIDSNGVIQRSRPYSLSQHPQPFNPGTKWNENLFDNPNPVSQNEWSKYDLTSGNQDGWSAEERENYLRSCRNNEIKKNLLILGGVVLAVIVIMSVIKRCKGVKGSYDAIRTRSGNNEDLNAPNDQI